MLSNAAGALPAGEGWQFEPKWDGFRTLVFRDHDEILLQSRDEKPMNRYFPELVAPLAAMLTGRRMPAILPSAPLSTARSSSSGPAGSTSRLCSCASIPPRRA
jgi:ATP dependent DNA ligase-like protein